MHYFVFVFRPLVELAGNVTRLKLCNARLYLLTLNLISLWLLQNAGMLYHMTLGV